MVTIKLDKWNYTDGSNSVISDIEKIQEKLIIPAGSECFVEKIEVSLFHSSPTSFVYSKTKSTLKRFIVHEYWSGISEGEHLIIFPTTLTNLYLTFQKDSL